MNCFDLTPEQLTDSPLARLAVHAGYSSLTTLLNDNGWWSLNTDEVLEIIDNQLATKP
jgi:uncharacterized membrane protein